MVTFRSPHTAAEWEELQRECHFFPVFVDYIYDCARELEAPLSGPQPYQQGQEYVNQYCA
jgi:hypothetical protein